LQKLLQGIHTVRHAEHLLDYSAAPALLSTF